MIHSDVINSLSEIELSMLLYIINILFPCGSLEIDSVLLKSYRYEILAKYISGAESMVAEDGKETFNSLKTKLGIAA